MSYYTYTYVFSILLSIFGGWLVWKHQKNLSWLFFLIFTLFSSLWFLLYFLFFLGKFSPDILLLISRSAFWIAITTVYSLLYFVIYFWRQEIPLWSKKLFIPLLAFVGIICIYMLTDWIIYWLEYSISDWAYREIVGPLFTLHILGHMIFFVLFCYFSYRTIRTQDNLNKIRLKNILLSAFILLFSIIVLQLILPYFSIWILEKEIIFLFTLFVISVPVIIRRYYFSHIGYWVWKFSIVVISLTVAFILTLWMKYFFIHMNIWWDLSYWMRGDDKSLFEILFTIIIYFPIHSYLQRILLWDHALSTLSAKFQILKKSVSIHTDTPWLNTLLKKEMQNIFKTRSSSIHLYDEHDDFLFFTEIEQFFIDAPTEKVFINDIVFIENHKKNLHVDVLGMIPKDIFLLFPLYNTTWHHIWLFILGPKRFWDFYTLPEIDILREFSFFLEIHLKYIRTYSTMQDLSMNLDRKVDEKTIEYNDLINRQKEFIGVISHEIKSPIAAAIFQSDSIIDDLDSTVFSHDALKAELSILNSQLVRTGWLISKLFSVQYYDTHAVNLFRENINFAKFLEYEIELFSHIYPDITFISDISIDIWFIEIDKVQFQQVINNLLDNAVKFTSGMDSIIAISATKLGASLQLIIEDSGTGFQWVKISDIFDKYTTWNNGATGLGMWLYLCKKIISMHEGSIEASVSPRYHGACFTILIPMK